MTIHIYWVTGLLLAAQDTDFQSSVWKLLQTSPGYIRQIWNFQGWLRSRVTCELVGLGTPAAPGSHRLFNGERWVPHSVCHSWAPLQEKLALSLPQHNDEPDTASFMVCFHPSTQFLLDTCLTFAVLLIGILCGCSAAPLEGSPASRLTWDIVLCLIEVSWYLRILSQRNTWQMIALSHSCSNAFKSPRDLDANL